jgi:septum formation protein
MMPAPLVLASSSPRRHALIRYLGVPFIIDPSGLDESVVDAPDPATLAVTLAEAKAGDVARRHPRAVVIGADTLVELRGQVLNKPRDAEEASRMLGLLAGNIHQVHSGIAVSKAGRCATRLVTASVRMRPADVATIAAYVATGEPLDKAGAYAAQGEGAALIEGVEGSYLAVVGLPLLALRDLLLEAGVPVPADPAVLVRLERGEWIAE